MLGAGLRQVTASAPAWHERTGRPGLSAAFSPASSAETPASVVGNPAPGVGVPLGAVAGVADVVAPGISGVAFVDGSAPPRTVSTT